MEILYIFTSWSNSSAFLLLAGRLLALFKLLKNLNILTFFQITYCYFRHNFCCFFRSFSTFAWNLEELFYHLHRTSCNFYRILSIPRENFLIIVKKSIHLPIKFQNYSFYLLYNSAQARIFVVENRELHRFSSEVQ